MKKLLLLLLFAFTSQLLPAQQKPAFYDDVQKFKELDKKIPPPQNSILFIGSSSFTMWPDVQEYFPGYPIINRGFGGSSLTHLIYYFNDLVPPYNPKQIIIYCGENDLANDATPADSVVNRFKRLFTMIRDYDKKVPVAYVSMKPSPSREKYLSKFKVANKKIKRFLWWKRNAKYINIYDAMLDASGKPREDIFLNDRLHMNKEGYKIWQQIIHPYLKK